jgi:hypothetical protein
MVMMPTSRDGRGRSDLAAPTPATVMLVEEVDTSVREHDEELVLLRYGTTCRRLPAGSWTVGQAKRWARSVWGVAYFVDVCLNGQLVSLDAVPRPGDTLVFVRPPGRKGAENWSDGAEEVFRRYPELRAIAEEIASRRLDARRSMEHAFVEATRFFTERCGRPEQSDMPLVREVLRVFADTIKQLADGLGTPIGEAANKENVDHRQSSSTTPKILIPQAEDMTTVAVAKEIGCSRSMVYKLRDCGELSYRRVGSRCWFTRASVEKYKQKTTTQAQPPAPPSAGYQFKHL